MQKMNKIKVRNVRQVDTVIQTAKLREVKSITAYSLQSLNRKGFHPEIVLEKIDTFTKQVNMSIFV